MISMATQQYDVYKLYNYQMIYVIGTSLALLWIMARFVITVVLHKKNYISYSIGADGIKNAPRIEKLLVCLFVLSIVVVTIQFGINLIPKKHVRNLVRPENFPSILIVPDNAYDFDYLTPSNTKISKGVYSVNFFVDEPYPSDNLRNFFSNHFSSNGWQKLMYGLLNPKVPIYKNPIFPDSNAIFLPKGIEGKWPLNCEEDWINAEEDRISISFAYNRDPNNKLDLNKIQINMTFFNNQSWMNRYIKVYKQLHPEEFEEENDK
ncbi:MAG: hypothetical protein ACYSSI_04895 [Planctomycetota bacterium]